MQKGKKVEKTPKKDRRSQIIKCGLKIFCQKGYEQTKIDDIVSKVGCSHGLFYHYFKTKKDLFHAIVTEKNTESENQLFLAINSASSYTQKLNVILDSLYKEIYHNENYAYHFYLFVSSGFNRRDKKLLKPTTPPPKFNPFTYIQNLFEDGQKFGEFTLKYTPKECTEMFFSIVNGATLSYVIAPKEIRKNFKLPKIEFILDVFKKEA